MPKHIPVIAISGGPCAGKTTALSYLKQKLVDIGFVPIVVGEAATELILSGITPAELGRAQFQRELLQFTILKEDRFREAARHSHKDRVVIICDRGIPDSAAYMPPSDFELMLNEAHMSIVDIRDRRYDAVIFLRSVAVDAPEIYTQANNAARSESTEEAKAADERTLAAWTGHPHVHIIGNTGSMEQKSKDVFQKVCQILGIPAPLEIERKFLIRSCDYALLPRPLQEIHITQFYLQSADPGSEERVRLREQSGGQAFYHTVKSDIRPGVRNEIERQITREEYVEFLRRAHPQFGTIDKMRHCFVWKNQYFELDIFQKPQGLILLEIELAEEGKEIQLPDFLAPHAVDVTGEKKYSNKEIARSIA